MEDVYKLGGIPSMYFDLPGGGQCSDVAFQ